MIWAILFLQSTTLAPAQAGVPLPSADEKKLDPGLRRGKDLDAIDSATAVDAFKTICWTGFPDEAAFKAGLIASPLGFADMPQRESNAPGDVHRAAKAVVAHIGADKPNGPQCTLRARLAGSADQLTFSARVADALGLKGGTTRTGSGQAITTWQAFDADHQPVRVFAATRNAAEGGTEIRLAVLRPKAS